jgi:hypothetical protein
MSPEHGSASNRKYAALAASNVAADGARLRGTAELLRWLLFRITRRLFLPPAIFVLD